MFNLDDLIPNDIITVDLVHPVTQEVLQDEDGNVASVKVYGPGKEREKAVHAILNRGMKRKEKDRTAEQMKQDSTQIMVACVQSIDNLALPGGRVIGSNKALIEELLADPRFAWAREQIDNAVTDLERAFCKS